MKVGILGGTFDPIHLAHLIIAEEARSRLELDRVIFIPAGEPWMKSGHDITPAGHRLEMVKSAIQSNRSFAVSGIEVEREGPTYTVDTLEQLWRDLGHDTRMFLIVGWDSLADMLKWKAPYRISKMATLLAFPRPGYPRPLLTDLELAIPGISERVVMFDEPYIGISSTAIREHASEGKSIRYLVPEVVEKYIFDHGLYREKK